MFSPHAHFIYPQQELHMCRSNTCIHSSNTKYCAIKYSLQSFVMVERWGKRERWRFKNSIARVIRYQVPIYVELSSHYSVD